MKIRSLFLNFAPSYNFELSFFPKMFLNLMHPFLTKYLCIKTNIIYVTTFTSLVPWLSGLQHNTLPWMTKFWSADDKYWSVDEKIMVCLCTCNSKFGLASSEINYQSKISEIVFSYDIQNLMDKSRVLNSFLK